MLRTELVVLHQELCGDARRLLEKKNQDYAEENSIFGNLDMPEHAGLTSTETGIVIRMFDKMARVAKGVKRPLACEDEKLSDTLLDLINYAVLLEAKLRTRSTPVQSNEPPSGSKYAGLNASEQRRLRAVDGEVVRPAGGEHGGVPRTPVSGAH